MRIKTTLAALLIFAGILSPAGASAHVLLPDTKGKSGAIFHVTPGDDPSAGVVTGMYFDVKTAADFKEATIRLNVSSESGGINQDLPVSIKGKQVSGAFTFPARGTYYLTLSINPKQGESTIIRNALRVGHSTTGANPAPRVPSWAIIGLIFSLWALTITIVNGVQRYKSPKK